MKEQTIQILYEDEHIIVCVKPGGIPTQTKKIGCPDMISILKNHIRKQDRAVSRFRVVIPVRFRIYRVHVVGVLRRGTFVAKPCRCIFEYRRAHATADFVCGNKL